MVSNIDHHSTDNGAIHLALMIWFVGMNDTRVLECTSLYYKLKDDVTNFQAPASYWEFVYCARQGFIYCKKSETIPKSIFKMENLCHGIYFKFGWYYN